MDAKIQKLHWSNDDFYKVALKYLKKGKEPPPEWSQYRKNNFLNRFAENVHFNLEQNEEDGKPIIKYKNKEIVPSFRVEKILIKLYSDPLTSGSRNKLFAAVQEKYIGITREKINEFLKKRESYQLFQPQQNFKTSLKRIRRRKPNELWHIDLIVFSNIKNFNNAYSFLLVVIDNFSKYVFLEKLKTKSELEVSKAMKKIFNSPEITKVPKVILSDNRKEFKNKTLSKLFQDYDVKQIFTRPYLAQENAQVERFNKTFKTSLWKYRTLYNTKNWINIYKELVKKYNDSPHSSLGGMSPKFVYVCNDKKVWEKVKEIQQKDWPNAKKTKKYEKLERGDWVRISIFDDPEVRKKEKFRKGYLENFSRQIYKVIKKNSVNDKFTLRNKDTKEIKKAVQRKLLLKIPKDTVFLNQERKSLKKIPGFDKQNNLREINARPKLKVKTKVKTFLEERNTTVKRKTKRPSYLDDFT